MVSLQPFKQIMVSVVVPVYNSEHLILDTLTSIAQQTYSHFEVIIVDDGSTDESALKCEAFCLTDSRFRLIRTSNQGQSAARNLGVKAADGEWVALCDSDDIWRGTKLMEQVRFIAKGTSRNGESLVAAGTLGYIGNSRGRIFGKHFRNIPSVEYFLDLRNRGQPILMLTSSVIFHRSTFEEVGGFDEALRTAEDGDLWTRLATKGLILVVQKRLLLIRMHGGSLTDATYIEQRLRGRWTSTNLRLISQGDDSISFEVFLACIQGDEMGYARLMRKLRGANFYRLGYGKLINRRYAVGIAFLLKSILLHPYIFIRLFALDLRFILSEPEWN